MVPEPLTRAHAGGDPVGGSPAGGGDGLPPAGGGGPSGSASPPVRPRAERLLGLALLALPFLLFWWQLPFLGSLTIGNDYTIFPTRHQQELFLSLANGSFPVFVPGFSGGHTASALTLGQLFHPQSHLAALSPGYWDGSALEWNTFWRLVSLGAVHLVWLRLLRRFGLGVGTALLASTALVYNLRMLDLFRYGASLESYTAFLFASAAAFWCWLSPRRVAPPAALAVAVYALVTSGHPQMMYYGLCGLGITILAAPFFCRELAAAPALPDGGDASPARGDVLRYAWRAIGASGLGLLLSAGYVAPFVVDFLGENVQRVGRDYAWADGYRDSLAGTLNSFFQPLYAHVGGAFGGSSLLLLGALVPLVSLRGPRGSRLPWVVSALWVLALLVFLHMQGGRTPVHRFVWSWFPLAGSFRIAGRVALLLPYLLVLLFVWLVRRDERDRDARGREPLGHDGSGGKRLGLACTFALVLSLIHAALPSAWIRDPVKWSPVHIGAPEWTHLAVQLAGWVLLAALALRETRLRLRGPRVRGALLGLACVAGLTQAAVCLRYGTWVEAKLATPTLAELRSQKARRFDFTGDPGVGLASQAMVEHALHGLPQEPQLGRLFDRWEVVPDRDEAYASLEQGRDPRLAIVEGAFEPAHPVQTTEAPWSGEVAVVHAGYNEQRFRVRSDRPTWFGLGHPFTERWRLFLDGDELPTHPMNGAYVGAPLPALPEGAELVARYESPAARYGLVGSALGLSLLAWLLAGAASRSPLTRGLLRALALASGPLVYLAWSGSLYAGRSFETQADWSASDTESTEAPRLNQAYWCRAWVGSLSDPDERNGTRGAPAVDGSREPDTGALSRSGANPTWTVELRRPLLVREVVIHEASRDLARTSKREAERPFNARPLVVQGSLDGRGWVELGVVRGRRQEAMRAEAPPVHRIVPEVTRMPLRFVRIVGRGTRLALAEVEVFGDAP